MRAVVAAFAFLTRLPVWSRPLRDVDLGRSVAFFPLVGLGLGLALTGLGAALGGSLAPLLAAALMAALLAALTGGLHLDGLADLGDALGGGRGDRARMLEIMRDSRIGAHGAAALVLLLIIKVAALADALHRRDFRLVLAFPAFARWAVTFMIVLYPYARPEGLGRAFNGESRMLHVAGATALVAGIVGLLGWRLALPAAAALGAAAVLASLVQRRLGGLTGDVYGAIIEVAEVAALVAGAARPS